jgi:hypothetical protein
MLKTHICTTKYRYHRQRNVRILSLMYKLYHLLIRPNNETTWQNSWLNGLGDQIPIYGLEVNTVD